MNMILIQQLDMQTCMFLCLLIKNLHESTKHACLSNWVITPGQYGGILPSSGTTIARLMYVIRYIIFAVGYIISSSELFFQLTYISCIFRECALSGVGGIDCTHRIKVGDSDQWHYISQQCRDRVSVFILR